MDIITKDNYCKPSVCSSGNGALLKKNFLGEFATNYEKERARKNLGIDFDNVIKSTIKHQDFINITDKYNIKNISISEAIRYIPPKYRKEGQVVTFIDQEDKWAIYQFKGESVNQWNNYTLWENLYKINFVDSIIPDDEDLELTDPDNDGNSKIKLKDRLFNVEEYSGKGYKILRKNIVEIEDSNTHLVNTLNYLYQDMIDQPSTIYEIRYDFDLSGQNINIPQNSILFFNGGSIDNGTVTMNNCEVIGTMRGTFVPSGEFQYSGLTADEEDITIHTALNNKSYLKLKDRSYNPELASGKGYKILRKNLSLVDGVIVNTLTQEMINEPNTVYEIRYDFDLDGNEISIPGHCVLNFTGGSISNGSIIYNSTELIGNVIYKNVNTNGLTSNYFSNGENKSLMFLNCLNLPSPYDKYNLPTDGVTDVAPLLNGLLNDLLSSNFNKERKKIILYIPRLNNGLLAKDTIYCNRITSLDIYLGSNITFDFSDIVLAEDSRITKHCIYLIGNSIKIYGIYGNSEVTINGGCDKIQGINEKIYESGEYSNFLQNGLYVSAYSEVIIKNIKVTNCYHCVSVTSNGYAEVSNVRASYSRYDNGIAVRNGTLKKEQFAYIHDCLAEYCNDIGIDVLMPNAVVENCIVKNCGNNGVSNNSSNFNAGGGFGVEFLSGRPYSPANILFNNCKAINCYNYGFYSVSKGVKYNNCYIDNIQSSIGQNANSISNNLRKGAAFINQCKDYGSGIIVSNCVVKNCNVLLALMQAIDREDREAGNTKDKSCLLNNCYTQNINYLYASKNLDNYAKISNSVLDYSKLYMETDSDGESYYKSNIVDENEIRIGVKRDGLFSEKPTNKDNIPIGFAYFCTDKKTTEGSTNGIIIYYKGDNVWVDALGRVVS